MEKRIFKMDYLTIDEAERIKRRVFYSNILFMKVLAYRRRDTKIKKVIHAKLTYILLIISFL